MIDSTMSDSQSASEIVGSQRKTQKAEYRCFVNLEPMHSRKLRLIKRCPKVLKDPTNIFMK
jgi:hypothetical protein